MQRWRVPLGFACAALFFLLAQSRPATLIVGGLVALPGLALRGFTIAAGRLILGLVFAALFLGIYVPVMRVETKTLAELFGKDYHDYAAAVPLFLPRVTAYRSGAAKAKFDPALYRRYREYQAAIGLVVAWLVLAIEWYWFR